MLELTGSCYYVISGFFTCFLKGHLKIFSPLSFGACVLHYPLLTTN